MTRTPLHDWLAPRLLALLQDAQAAGFSREAVVAVMADVVTMPPFDVVGPPATSEFRTPGQP